MRNALTIAGLALAVLGLPSSGASPLADLDRPKMNPTDLVATTAAQEMNLAGPRRFAVVRLRQTYAEGQRDLTCSDFASQDEAQAALDADPGDPHGLDIDLDGIACETPLVAPAERDAARAQRAEREERATQRAAATPLATGVEDLDCVDFMFQEDAQAVYDRNPADPYNLDPTGDGFACSTLPSRVSGAVAPSR